jgi:DNA-binding FrmR family transcriptional regulator
MESRLSAIGWQPGVQPKEWIWTNMTETGPEVTMARLREEISLSFGYIIPPSYMREKHTGSKLTKQKLDSRIKRIRGQVDSIERSLTICDDCADVPMLLANLCGVIVPADSQVISSLCMSAIRLVLTSLTPVRIE